MFRTSADCLLTINDRGVVDGVLDVGTALNVKALCKSLTIDDSVGVVELSGFGALRHAHRSTKGETRITADFLIAITGRIPVTLGNYVTLIFTVFTGLSALTFTGILVGETYNINDEREQIQRLTIICDAAVT